MVATSHLAWKCLHLIKYLVQHVLFIWSRRTGYWSRRLAGNFKHSARAIHILKKFQMTTTVPRHRLIQNELTRWNSSLDMLKRLQEQKRAIY
ncbi:hypothetical protein PR048_013545 [Dryococelus australis]|uniref:Uncharacterized protein n=1 Tax=Dryococelus australis TaxID=614101 RepID=A0ABQ9HSS7_9NEOP|nr:hypothetical protein PR048_013545 [Dryococelus australis]